MSGSIRPDTLDRNTNTSKSLIRREFANHIKQRDQNR